MEDVLSKERDPTSRYKRADKRHHMATIVDREKRPDGTTRIVYAPEILITAPNRLAAQRAANLAAAAKTLLDGDFTTGHPFTVVPDDPEDLEDLQPDEYEDAIRTSMCTYWLAQAMAVAAKATQRRRWTFAMVKYWLSLRTCSVPSIEHHPKYGDRFTVERDPVNHAVMAEAIVTGYSAIEELDLQVNASRKKPSKDKHGRWDPDVLGDLQRRLHAASIDIDETLNWQLRGPPTRIERRHAPPAGERAPWARYDIRDRNVQIVDAISYASLLRSQVSAHTTKVLTRSLTINDVHNVQHLARRLILETMGFWWRLVPPVASRTRRRQ